ncbi:peptide ABC transporter substrate-binding protein [Inquilinus limosus]|uniref:Peptide ABC transporter substrate-binding protein n=2 Tax=Inquilinus limosus TaxID=171674 RepID=A0A211ZN59_9PROT|nr:peptide ABC transporter substrate-binding protein [Inquilinus limosus]
MFVAGAATPGNALVMAWNIDAISTFDPAQIGEVVTNEIVQNTCDSLVDFNPADETKVIPLFAESWDVSDDRMQITFHLRKGAVFPSGNPATAADTAWSMQRVVKLGFGNAATLTEYGFTKDKVDSQITAPDDATLVMKLDKPYPTNLVLQAIAANRVSATMDKQAILANEVNGDLGNKYLATHTECVGPYRLAQWNAGEAVVLQANDKYWGEPPALKRVLIRHVAEAGTQRLLLTQGDVDVARDLTPEDMKDLESSPDVSIVRVLKPQLFFWTFNNADPIFSNEKVRLAMRYLIDYDGLAKTVMTYTGVPRASFVQLGAVGALDEKEGQPFSLDLDKAKALLAEAGYPNGFKATVFIGTLPHSAPIAQSVQQNAAKVGVELTLERMANAQLFSRVRGREFQTAMQAWQTGVPDAHGNASRLVYNPDNRPEAKQTQYPSWRAAYYSEDANKQVDAALLEPDPEKRNAMYRDLQLQIMQQGPMAFMFQMYNPAAIRKSLKNWTWNGFRTYYESVSK